MTDLQKQKTSAGIDGAGSGPNVGQRRSGASPNDPHGGHERPDSELHGPDPDPAEEMNRGGPGKAVRTRHRL